MTIGVMPGTLANAVASPLLKAPMKAGSEAAGNPAATAAFAIHFGKCFFMPLLKAAALMAEKTAPATARDEVVQAVAVAINLCGVDS